MCNTFIKIKVYFMLIKRFEAKEFEIQISNLIPKRVNFKCQNE